MLGGFAALAWYARRIHHELREQLQELRTEVRGEMAVAVAEDIAAEAMRGQRLRLVRGLKGMAVLLPAVCAAVARHRNVTAATAGATVAASSLVLASVTSEAPPDTIPEVAAQPTITTVVPSFDDVPPEAVAVEVNEPVGSTTQQPTTSTPTTQRTVAQSDQTATSTSIGLEVTTTLDLPLLDPPPQGGDDENGRPPTSVTVTLPQHLPVGRPPGTVLVGLG